MNIVNPQTALVSLSDKSNLNHIIDFLVKKKIKILSTGGTYNAIKEITDNVVEVSEFTGFDEMMDGRVKTLHPKIHAGILARRDSDLELLEEKGYEAIDLVIVNLYPFEETIKKDCSFEDAIENIDIGGPTMIRAAAKNFQDVVVLSDPNDYEKINDYNFSKSTVLRYGENPHQSASLLTFENLQNKNIANADILQGKELSYNNIVDADAAWECVRELSNSGCVIVKHANPCGVAEANSISKAYDLAFKTDPTSAFGGIIAFNQTVDSDTAKVINERQFVEVIIAPDYEKEAIEEFSKKKNIRVLKVDLKQDNPYPGTIKRVSGGILIQDDDLKKINSEQLKCVSKRNPTDHEIEDLIFAWKVAKFVKSNAIVYVKNKQTIGIGAGQMSRVISAEIANLKAHEEGLEVKNAVMASDAFFPFRDGIDKAASSGIAAIIQPGGSIRDDEVIAAADEHDIAMLFTGVRHFRH